MHRLRAIDLFSGAGGLSCGFERAGGEVVAAVEFDPHAAATFQLNHPTARVWQADIRSLDPACVSAEVGPIDVILGGPMCQGVSQRGPRHPHDPRNFAFWAYADFVRKLRPRHFVMENVPALASDVHNRELAIAVFEELESLGYHLSAEVVNAAWFGVPQLRYRLIVVGSLEKRIPFPDAVAFGVRDQIPEDTFATVGEAICDLPSVPPGGGFDSMPYHLINLPEYGFLSKVAENPPAELFNHWSADTDEINLQRIRFVPEGGNWHDIPLEFLPPRFRSVRPTDHTTTYRRLDRTHPAHTVTTECGNVTSGAYTHPVEDRAITVREAARLQSFPDRFRFVGPRNSQYRQVGNAVPPFVSVAITEALLGAPGSHFGRLSLDLLRQYPAQKLPFTLAPRYKALFGNSSWVKKRRQIEEVHQGSLSLG